jgi:hypothetical protein
MTQIRLAVGTAVGAAVVSVLLSAPALSEDLDSITFVQFTQQTSEKIAHYDAIVGGNTLTVAESPVFFVVTAFGPLGFYASTLSMFASSSATITNLGLQFEQVGWSGTMVFGDGMNFLTVAFENATFSYDGTGGSASLISTDPLNPIAYSSDLLSLPEFAFKNLALAFTGVTPPFNVGADGYGEPFKANLAGSFAGSGFSSVVPEPATWGMLVLGFGLLGVAARRRPSFAKVAG